ncbi:MAG: hypothetical protein M5R36_29990 [Deltaproteobacteria bacterium]|nr:hypothetical protein [Deltaproteobacteria bacterium]
MTYTDTIVAHLDKHRAMILPLARQCLRAGFSLTMVKGGTETATAFIAETGDFEPAYAIARDHADPADAAMVIKLFERPLTGTTYNQSGKSNINLIFLQGSAREFFSRHAENRGADPPGPR